MSWPSDAVPGGGIQSSNQFSQKCRTNPEEFRRNLEDYRQGRKKLRKFRGNLEEI
jgi:hypothetical protein